MDVGKKGDGGERLGKVEGGKTCGQSVIYKRRINF